MHIRTNMMTMLHLSSILIVLYSLTMLPPMLIGLLYGEKDLASFLLTLVGSLAVGVAGYFACKTNNKALRIKDGFLVVVLFWLVVSLISAMPFVLDARLNLSVTDAFFEGISGITTTGASVLSDIDTQPKSVLYYRAQLNFLGGLGIIVLAIALLPMLGIGGAKLYRSEMPGPLKEETLTPRLADTAKHLWFIYTSLAFFCALAFYLAGMDVFDALCHSLSTVSLGGFSPHGASLAFYDSKPIELVAGTFSILAAVNFALYFAVLHGRSLLPVIRNAEFRFFILIVSVITAFTCFELYRTGTFNGPDALVHGYFQTISILADNGLTGANYPAWPAHIVLLLLGASYFGGCVGSTCGGIKAMRFLLLYRQSQLEIRQLLHPHAVLIAKVGRTPVPIRLMRSVWGFFFLYIFVACVFMWGLVACGHDVVTAFGTVSACLNNMGVGYGDTATGFGTLAVPAKWLMCVAMLFGRLEIFPILVIFSRSFWQS